MRIPDYDEWYEKTGADQFEDLLDAMDNFLNENNIGSNLVLKSARVMLESNEPDILMEWYEAYTSGLQDYAYDLYKDEMR